MFPVCTLVPPNARLQLTAIRWATEVALKARFTKLQGQYLAFIHAYTKIHSVAPAEADMQQYFRVTPPSVGMSRLIKTLPPNTH